MNLRQFDDGSIGIALDELTTATEVHTLWTIFAGGKDVEFTVSQVADRMNFTFPNPLARTSKYLTHPVFHRYHAEHEMLRYIHRLQARDLSLCIP